MHLWRPGETGNWRGRPRLTAEQREARALLTQGTPAAARRLLELVDSVDEKVALAACQVLLARLPAEEIEQLQTSDAHSLAEQLRWLAELVAPVEPPMLVSTVA